MFYQIILNFSLLFTFTVLIFWPFIHYFNYTNRWSRYASIKPVAIGIAFGIIGALMPYFTLDFYNGLILSARFIPLLFCGLLGGPIALLIAGLLMTAVRLILFDVSIYGLVMSLNFLMLTCILFFITKKYPLKYDNIHRYALWLLFEIAILLLFIYNFSMQGIQAILTLIIFSWLAFYAIRIVLEQSHFASSRVKQTFALNQIDYLTQLPNNYAIEAHLKHLSMHSLSFSYLHIDIDHFKHYNFQHSYQVGDQILGELAKLIKRHANENNAFVGRVGGEEFCYVVQNTPPAIAIHEADKIRTLIANHIFLQGKDLNLKVTVSIGISTYPENGPLLDQIFEHANRALHSIGEGKTNKICHYNQYLKNSTRL